MQTRYASQWLNPGDENSPCNIALRIVPRSFYSHFFRVTVWDRKEKRVNVNLILTIDPSISTLYSTLHFVPQHLILMTRAPQTF